MVDDWAAVVLSEQPGGVYPRRPEKEMRDAVLKIARKT